MSQRLTALKREVEALRYHFLPDPFDPLGQYAHAAKVQAYTRAFLVLSHAEIETFLEQWAKHLATACEDIWNQWNRVVEPMAFLVGTVGEKVPPAALNAAAAVDSHQRFAAVVKKTFETYYKRVNDNNGVKEKNLLDLFDPLGVPAAAFTATLLPNLNDLGKMRGKHAHHSRRAVQSVLDPETEYKRIGTVLADLNVFDQWLVRYRKTIR